MNSLTKGYEKYYGGNCQKCSLHCMSSIGLQAKVLKLEKKNEMLENNKEELMGEQRRCIEKLADFSDEKKKLEIVVKNVCEEKKKLEIVVKNVCEEKKKLEIVVKNVCEEKKKLCEENDMLKRILESRTQTDFSDEKKKLEIVLKNVCEEKKKLEIVVKNVCEEKKKVCEENNKLKRNLESRTQTINRFLSEQVKVIQYSEMKTMGRLLRSFQGVRKKIGNFSTEHLNILQTLQEVQQTCGNCRESFQNVKVDCENQIVKLQNEQLNYKFIIGQLEILITTLREEIKKLKEEKKEILRSTKRDGMLSQENLKSCKEKVQTEILLPPTPDSWSTSQDTISSDDIGFDLHQSNISENHAKISPVTLEFGLKSEHVKVIPKPTNIPKKPTRRITDSFEKESTNYSKLDIHHTSRNPIKKPSSKRRGRRKKMLFEPVNLDAIDHHSSSNFQEVLSEQLCDKDKVPLKVIGVELKKGRALSLYQPKGALAQTSNNLFVKKTSTAFKDVSVSNVYSDDSCSIKEIAPRSEVEGNQKRESVKYLSIQLQKPLEEPVNESANMCAELACDKNLNSHLCLMDDARTIIGSEGWSPQHDLESYDFEASLNQLTWFPEMISPLRQSPKKKSRNTDNKDYLLKSRNSSQALTVDNKIFNDESIFGNTKQPKSIFSPILKNETHCRTPKLENKTKNIMDNEVHEPDEIWNKAKFKIIQQHEEEDCAILKSGMSMRKLKNVDTIKFENKSFGGGPFPQKESIQLENHIDVSNETKVPKITNYLSTHDKNSKDKLTGKMEDGIIPLKINPEEKYKNLQNFNENLMKNLNLSSDMPREILSVDKRVNCWMEDEFKYGIKNEFKCDMSELGKTIYEDKPLDQSFSSGRDNLSKSPSKCDIVQNHEKIETKENQHGLKPESDIVHKLHSNKLNSEKSEDEGFGTPSNFSSNDNVQGSSLTTFDPKVTVPVSQNIDSQSAFPRRKSSGGKLSRELKALNISFSQDFLFTSPQSKHTTSPISVRSPTAMEYYALRLSPRVPNKLQYCEISPVKSGKKSSPKRNRVMSHTRKNVQLRSNVNYETSPRSPESMKHYNMRTKLKYRNNYSSLCASGVKVKSTEIIKTKASLDTSVQKPIRFKKSTILPNVAKNNADILLEIKAQSSKDDSDPLEVKLALMPQERMNKLMEQERLRKPVEICVGSTIVDGMSENRSKTQTLMENISDHIKKPSNNENANKSDEKVICKSNTPRTSDNIVERDQKSINSRILHCIYSQKGNLSIKNDLLKIVDSTLSESSATAAAKLSNPISRITQDCFLRRSQELTNYFIQPYWSPLKTPVSKIDVTPVPVTETTVSQESLLIESDLSYKMISYRSNLFPCKRKHIQDESDKTRSSKKRPPNKDFLKTVNSNQNCHINLQRLSSGNTPKLSNSKNTLSRECHSKSQNTNEVPKANASKVTDTLTESDVSEGLSKGFNKSYSGNENSSNQEEMLPHQNIDIVTTTLCPGEIVSTNEFHSSSSPQRDDNSKSEEEDADYLVIDVDETSVESSEGGIDSSLTKDETIFVSKSLNKMYPETKLSSRLEIKNDKKLFSRNMEFNNEKTKTSGPLSSSCIISNFQSLPEAICKYNENLIKTNTDNIVLPFSDRSKKNQGEGSSDNVFLPKFYIEHVDSLQVDTQASNIEEVSPKEDDSFNINMINNCAFKVKTLDDFIPSGVKTKVTENVLRTVLNKHAQDLPYYKERNILERRIPDNKVTGDLTEEMVEIMNHLFQEDLKSVTEIYTLVNQLKQYEIRVVVKAMMMLLYKLAVETYNGNPKASWLLHWNVPQIANKKSPFVHPRIQSAHLVLVTLISQFIKEMSDEEKKCFLEEELHFFEQTFIGSNTDFTDTLPAFWLNLGFLYTLLARQFKFMVRVREFMYDMLYCYSKRGLTVAYSVLSVWPSVLNTKPKTSSSSDPLTLCIVYSLTTVLPEFMSSNIRTKNNCISWQLRELLKRKYKYLENSINGDQLFDLCFQRLEQSGVHEAVVLLAKRQRREWFKQRPLQQLMSVLEGWWKGGDECTDVRAAAAVNILCTSLRSYNGAEIQPEIAKLFTLFQEILADENTPEWMQEVIILNTCRLARLNVNMCLDVISNWRPVEISQKVIDQILLGVIRRRSPKWWATHRVGHFYLCHR